MSFDPKVGLHQCDVCRRPMNPTDSLTPMYKPGVPKLEICPAKGCWDTANERGHYSQHQQQPE
jgi:hypothetical protein